MVVRVREGPWIALGRRALTRAVGFAIFAAVVGSCASSPRVHEVDLSADPDALTHFIGDGKAIFDAGSGWAVLYEDNGIPNDSTHRLASDPDVDEAALVFTNVNSVMEFGYWRSGERLLEFEFPSDRYGTRPDATYREDDPGSANNFNPPWPGRPTPPSSRSRSGVTTLAGRCGAP
jgi:hypothetical protein